MPQCADFGNFNHKGAIMKPIEIDRNSWHYKAAEFSDHGKIYYCKDICQYSRRVLGGCFWIALISLTAIFFTAMLTYMAADFIAWVAAMIVHLGWVQPEPAALATLMLLVVGSCVVTLFAIPRVFRTVSEKIDMPFVKTAYSSWKEKWCAPIEIKEKQ